MNQITYNEIYSHAQSIHNFKELVKKESKHPILARILSSLASIEPSQAIEFIREYYSRMDIVLTAPAVLFNDLQLKVR
jgi:hypothetical protein